MVQVFYLAVFTIDFLIEYTHTRFPLSLSLIDRYYSQHDQDGIYMMIIVCKLDAKTGYRLPVTGYTGCR